MSAFGPGNTYAPGPVLPPVAITFAGFWVRTGAYLTDAILISVANSVIFGAATSNMFGVQMEVPETSLVPVFTMTGLSMLFPAIYTIAFWLSSGATPGKMALGLKVVSSDTGGPITTGQAIGRFFAYILSSLVLCLGFIWVAFDGRKQGWHDKLASTVVVRRNNTVPVTFGR